MFKLENIIPLIISIVLLGAVGYYLYNKINNQHSALVTLSRRCEALEMMFMRPPGAELDSVLDEQNVRPQTCKDGRCTIEPILIDNNELDQILTDELSQLRKKPTRKSKKNLAIIDEEDTSSISSDGPKDK